MIRWKAKAAVIVAAGLTFAAAAVTALPAGPASGLFCGVLLGDEPL
jgi:hypothetical protein